VLIQSHVVCADTVTCCVCWYSHMLYVLIQSHVCVLIQSHVVCADTVTCCMCWYSHMLHVLIQSHAVCADTVTCCVCWYSHMLYVLIQSHAVCADTVTCCVCWYSHMLCVLIQSHAVCAVTHIVSTVTGYLEPLDCASFEITLLENVFSLNLMHICLQIKRVCIFSIYLFFVLKCLTFSLLYISL